MPHLGSFSVTWLVIAWIGVSIGNSLAQDTLEATVSPATVSSIHEIRGLPDALRVKNPEVSLRGVVTFRHPASGLTYVEDDQGGIELRGLGAMEGLETGRRIEAIGRVDDSLPIPGVAVRKDAVRVFDRQPLPPGFPLGAGEVRTGVLDGRRVTMDAALFSMLLTSERGDPPWLVLNVGTPFGHFTWLVPWENNKPLPTSLLHSKVRGTGVCEAIFNNRGQRIGVLLFVKSIDDVEVLRPPSRDPFTKPTRSLAELMRPGLDDPYERVRVEGVVLCQQQQTEVNLIHLRTDQGALQVEMLGGRFDIGDRVAVVGYPVLDSKHVVLRESIARKIGHEIPPEPLEMGIDDLMRTGSDSDLVRIRGVVVRNGLEADQGSLFIESSDLVVEVVLSSAFDHLQRKEMARELKAATQLELTGVADLQGPMLITGTVNITDMKLTLRTPADIVIVHAPPWWTTGRLLALAGILAGVLALSSAWVFMLRRRVAAQTVTIRDKVGRETRWVERSRIARDIHDDVGSALTQITLLGDLGKRSLGDERRMEEQFERISSQAREAVRALDAIVWTVNPKNDSLSVTVSYLCQMVQDMTRDAGIRCRLEIPDEVPEVVLGAKFRHNLLLAAKEAVHNAMKHSGADRIRLRLDCGPDSMRLEVIDDGCGFDPATATCTRTGLDSMRQRMADLGGSFELISQPGQGTTVAFVVPWAMVR